MSIVAGKVFDVVIDSGHEVAYYIKLECIRCGRTHEVAVSVHGVYNFSCDGQRFVGFLNMDAIAEALAEEASWR